MFDPTEKQLAALANMARFLGLRSHQDHFASREAFDDYWQKLDRRCRTEKQRRQRQSPEQARQKRTKSLARYYNDRTTLLEYARGYYHRYLPAEAKLAQQLQTKCQSPDLVASVMTDMQDFVDDTGNARERAASLARQGKTPQQIRQSLQRRRYTRDVIETALQELQADPEPQDDRALQRRMQNWQRKNWSTMAIKQRLRQEGVSDDVIERLLQEFSQADSDQVLLSTVSKLLDRRLTEAQIIGRLQRKGHRYQAIRAALDETLA